MSFVTCELVMLPMIESCDMGVHTSSHVGYGNPLHVLWESSAGSTAIYHIYILTLCMSQIYEAGSAPPLIVGGLTATAAREAAEVCLFIVYLYIYIHIIYLSMMPHEPSNMSKQT